MSLEDSYVYMPKPTVVANFFPRWEQFDLYANAVSYVCAILESRVRQIRGEPKVVTALKSVLGQPDRRIKATSLLIWQWDMPPVSVTDNISGITLASVRWRIQSTKDGPQVVMDLSGIESKNYFIRKAAVCILHEFIDAIGMPHGWVFCEDTATGGES